MKKYLLLIILFLSTAFLSLLAILVTVSSGNHITQKAEEIVKLCKESRKSDFCYIDAFSGFSKNNDLTESITLLTYIQNKDHKTNNCHFIAHVIAFEELKKNPETWEELFTKIPIDACTGGYLMGILEGYQYENQTSLNKQSVPEICSRIAQNIKISSQISSESSCDHIIGHLILAQEGTVDKALAICSSLKKTSQKECFAGVFMESEVQRNLTLHNGKEPMMWTEESTAKQESLCKAYTGDTSLSCWRELSHMIVFIEKSLPSTVYTYCTRAPNDTARAECYLHGVGIMAVSSRFNNDNLSLLCQPYSQNTVLLDSCIRMVVGTLVGSSSSLADTAAEFCTTIPQQNQRYCYNRLGIGLAGRDKGKTRTAICSKIPKEYQRICLQS